LPEQTEELRESKALRRPELKGVLLEDLKPSYRTRHRMKLPGYRQWESWLPAMIHRATGWGARWAWKYRGTGKSSQAGPATKKPALDCPLALAGQRMQASKGKSIF